MWAETVARTTRTPVSRDATQLPCNKFLRDVCMQGRRVPCCRDCVSVRTSALKFKKQQHHNSLGRRHWTSVSALHVTRGSSSENYIWSVAGKTPRLKSKTIKRSPACHSAVWTRCTLLKDIIIIRYHLTQTAAGVTPSAAVKSVVGGGVSHLTGGFFFFSFPTFFCHSCYAHPIQCNRALVMRRTKAAGG